MGVRLIYCNLYVKYFLISCLKLDDKRFAIRPSVQRWAKSSSWFDCCKFRNALLTPLEGCWRRRLVLYFFLSVPCNIFAVSAEKQCCVMWPVHGHSLFMLASTLKGMHSLLPSIFIPPPAYFSSECTQISTLLPQCLWHDWSLVTQWRLCYVFLRELLVMSSALKLFPEKQYPKSSVLWRSS